MYMARQDERGRSPCREVHRYLLAWDKPVGFRAAEATSGFNDLAADTKTAFKA